MKWGTQGKRYHVEQKLPIFHLEQETFSPEAYSEADYKIIFITSGSGLLRLNARPHPVIAPAVCCLNETESAVLEEGSMLRAESLYFHPVFVNAAFTFSYIQERAGKSIMAAEQMDYDSLRPFHHKRRVGLYQLGPMQEQRIRSLMKVLQDQLSCQPDSYWPCRSRSYLLELLFVLLQLYIHESDQSEDSLPDDVSGSHPVILFLLNHYPRKIVLDELARGFGTNRRTLNLQFKNATGFSVIDYLIRLRMRIARQLLQDTRLPVAEVAERVGYSDVTHFGRLFRKHAQVSPSAYRKRH